jgi:hypothetical protein
MRGNSDASCYPVSTALEDWDTDSYPLLFLCHARHNTLRLSVLPSPLISSSGLKELIIENS